jgi:two-component system response regulator ChvI
MFENGRDITTQAPPVNFTPDVNAQLVRILLVDDDGDYREAAAVELEALGFEVVSCGCGEEMLALLDRGNWRGDVIVLDWRLPTGPAIRFMPELEKRGIATPVVFLTSIATVSAEIAALDRGAVDFIDKVRGIPILAKRLGKIVQTSKNTITSASREVQETLERGKLTLRPDTGRAYWDGSDVGLTLTEFKIVYLLASRPDEYFTYRAVYDCVRHAGFVAGFGDDGFRTNVRSSIRRIRNKFRKFADGFDGIENYPSFGYRWRLARQDIAGGERGARAHATVVTTA